MDVKFKMGTATTEEQLPEQEAGSLIVNKATQELLIDTDDGNRISLGSIKLIKTIDGTSTTEMSDNVKEVVGISLIIDDKEYYILAIEK